jgi:predicted alpha/beta-fold hydrolase
MSSGASQHKFKPAWWLPEGHSQTLWRKFAGSPAVNHARERVELSDGDFIDIDWLTAEEPAKNSAQPLVFILHGLCGSSSSSYVLSLQMLLIENGFNSVVMNFRGCSGELNRKAQAYHSGVSHDLEEVLRNVISRHKPEAVSLVGYSLGANVLLKWLGEQHDYSKIDKAVAVSTPFTLGLCSREMLSGLSRIYGRYFTRRLLSDYLHKRKEFELQDKGPELEELLGLGDVSRVSNIWEFDDQITAPLHGFESANDYYGRCSSIKFLPEISASTLLIQSYDDPLVPPVALPEAGMVSESTVMELSPKGGHVGFVSAQSSNWLEHRILQFLRD